MSEALYEFGGLRFWHEAEILRREQAIATLHLSLSAALQQLNSAWTFFRVEGPILTPRSLINAAYDSSDLFETDVKMGGETIALRAETTGSTYRYAEHLLNNGFARAPLCVWQVGKSFRREANDGASAAKLRFNEFYQCEFQCIYRDNTKADIRTCCENAIAHAISRFTRSAGGVRLVVSDRLPSYSQATRDVEVRYKLGWKEMASISTRTDFPMRGHLVMEVAVGLDRLVEVEASNPV